MREKHRPEFTKQNIRFVISFLDFQAKDCCNKTSISSKLHKENWSGKYALTLKTRNEAGNKLNGLFSPMALDLMN